jgi:PAS domain-containing protein
LPDETPISKALYLIDPDSGRFLDVNETACRTLGYRPPELLRTVRTNLDANQI